MHVGMTLVMYSEEKKYCDPLPPALKRVWPEQIRERERERESARMRPQDTGYNLAAINMASIPSLVPEWPLQLLLQVKGAQDKT